MPGKKYYSYNRGSYHGGYCRSGYGHYGRKRVSAWKIILITLLCVAAAGGGVAACAYFGVFGDALRFGQPDVVQESAASAVSKAPEPSAQSSQTSVQPSQAPAEKEKPEGKWVENVFVYDKKGYELFNENKEAAADYVKALSSMRKELGDNVAVYCLVAPSHALYGLPAEEQGSSDEKKSIETLYASLDQGIHRVNVADALEKQKQKYIYFGTDTNWTALGAYYAYGVFCKEAGLQAVALNSLSSGQIKGFKGSLHAATKTEEHPDGAPELDQNPDTVVYYKTQGYCRLLENGEKEDREVPMIAEFASGPNAYSAFIWGNNPYMKIETNLGTKRKLCIIKDSFGCAFAPFTAANFDEIMVVDPAYYEGNIVEYIKKNQYTDVLVLNSSATANNSERVRELKTIL